VPLLIKFAAAIPARVRVDRSVTLRDLPATLLDLAGLPGSKIPGVSLRRAWSVPESRGSEVISRVGAGVNTRPEDPVSRGPMISLIDDSLHYIRNGDGVEELYAFRGDPTEKSNLAELEGSRTGVVRFRARLGK
jgi:arylsulfatase A-like enzyme